MASPNHSWIAFLFLLVAHLALAAETPSPALLVVNQEGPLSIVNPATRAVVATVRTGDMPHETVASTDGKLAFVSNYGSGGTPGNTISVIDLVAQKEIRRVDLGVLRSPHGLAFAGNKLYFTAEANKIIGSYNPVTNLVDWLLGTGQDTTHMIAVSPDLTKIFTANIGSNSISFFDRSGSQSWKQIVIPVGKGPEGFDISDGKQLWVAHSRDGGVSVVDIFTKRVIQTFPVQTKHSNRLKFTPDGRLVLITDEQGGQLLVLQRTIRKELKRISLGHGPTGILINPESTRAYVAVSGDHNVAVINLKTLEIEARIETGTNPDGMAWVVR